jgi:hypothetical protein
MSHSVISLCVVVSSTKVQLWKEKLQVLAVNKAAEFANDSTCDKQ